MNIIFNIIKGGRGEGGLSVGNVKIELFVVSATRWQDAFYRIQKYRSQPKFSHFQNRKIHAIPLHERFAKNVEFHN